jgi:hypothetical protein
LKHCIALPLWCLLAAPVVRAQDNYEIQVYAYDTVEPGHTMFETHTNLTVQGSKTTEDGTYPTEHAVHETIEITHGFNSWFEAGFYIFTSVQPNHGWQFVGSHLRPRFRAPTSWRLPVGLSLSQEIGWQRRVFSVDTWTWEIRPIIDKEIGKWYFSFNPTLEKALHGENTKGIAFAPNFKASYKLTKQVAGGLEYYGGLGPIGNFDPLREQAHQILPAIDLDLSPEWEFNFGVGVGVTSHTDHLLVKMIIGRRFGR